MNPDATSEWGGIEDTEWVAVPEGRAVAEEVAARSPNRWEISDHAPCSECHTPITWHLDDPPGTPCGACAATHLEGHQPTTAGGPHRFEEDPWSTDAQPA